MTDAAQQRSQPIPAWLIRTIWTLHRALLRLTAGRLGLRRPTDTTWGCFASTTVGRRSGRERLSDPGYIEDGPNIVTPAMNGWLEPDPAWWLNSSGPSRGDGPVAGRAAGGQGAGRGRRRSGSGCGGDTSTWAHRRSTTRAPRSGRTRPRSSSSSRGPRSVSRSVGSRTGD